MDASFNTTTKSDIFDIKTLANASFYTTAGAECLGVLTLDINVSF
jgi:hypothetical protein